MTIDPNTQAAASNLIERAKNILLKPATTFDQIATEPADVNKLYLGYVLPLLVLSAICAFIGFSVIGMPFVGRLSMVLGLEMAVLRVVTGLVGIFAMAYIINALAPSFGSQADMGQAHKLAVYSSTAGLLAGVFAILPALAILGILGLYSLGLLYIGLPRLMKTPEDKRIVYFAVILVVCIVVGVILNYILGMITLSLGYNPMAAVYGVH